MYALIGSMRMAGHEDEERILALFSTKEKAQEYVKKATLKNPTWKKKYRSNTLLGNYDHADIEEYEEPDYLIDPEI